MHSVLGLPRGSPQVMSNIATFTTAQHEAYYCPMTGEGRLVLPCPEDDGADTWGATAFQRADATAMLALLAAAGVLPYDDEDGDEHVGYRPDGREVVALYGTDPITSTPTVAELAETGVALALLAGLLPAQRTAVRPALPVVVTDEDAG